MWKIYNSKLAGVMRLVKSNKKFYCENTGPKQIIHVGDVLHQRHSPNQIVRCLKSFNQAE